MNEALQDVVRLMLIEGDEIQIKFLDGVTIPVDKESFIDSVKDEIYEQGDSFNHIDPVTRAAFIARKRSETEQYIINPHLQREAQKVEEANGFCSEEQQLPDQYDESEGTDALSILEQAAEEIRDRAASRDIEQERSAELTVEIFNAITGKDLTEEEGWIFLLSLKLARSRRGTVNPDDMLDLVGYSALLAECASK